MQSMLYYNFKIELSWNLNIHHRILKAIRKLNGARVAETMQYLLLCREPCQTSVKLSTTPESVSYLYPASDVRRVSLII